MKWGVETKVPLFYHQKLQGTIDFWAYEPPRLTVLDYKSGRNRVDPEMNPQLIIYGAGLVEKLGIYKEVEKIRVGIMQPFVGGFLGHEPKWWEFDIEDLPMFELNVAYLALEAEGSLYRSRLIPGEEQCKYCPAKPHCPAIEDEMRRELAPESTVDMLSQEQKFAILDRVAVYRGFLDAVEEFVECLPENVIEQHGWYMKRGNRKFVWAKTEEEIIEALEKLSISPHKLSLKTPSMVRDEMGNDKAIAGLYNTEFQKSRLVRKKE